MQKLMQENENLLPNLCNYLMSYKPHTEKKPTTLYFTNGRNWTNLCTNKTKDGGQNIKKKFLFM